ncbi:hypothetical protein A9Q86_01690 [Flavobacteriales bacterium 33_180_T64]|nr:hypothetical protein A9Q86_01690 [Flavobacteriales bacterium 33_180_T64]
MRENFLYYIWQHKKFNVLHLKTTQLEPLEIISVGFLNLDSGPDYFNGQLRIGEQLWAGNIEIHVKSSDWYIHNHECDPAYDNVILHVVYEHDTEIFRNDNSIIPTLELKAYIDKTVLKNYYKLSLSQSKWINCEHDFPKIDAFTLNNWLERLFFERLERKSQTIEALLKASNNDWEAVLFKLLAKNFGLKVNGDSFLSLANSFDFSVIRKLQSNLDSLEALFFGQVGMLDKAVYIPYAIKLKEEYAFLKQKFQLETVGVIPFQFFRLRPSNFPTIRLSQLASLYCNEQQLFSKVISMHKLSAFYELFEVTTATFWKTHYTFEKETKSVVKKITKSFIELLLINTILPIKFCYAKQRGEDMNQIIIDVLSLITSEKNSIIEGFNRLKNVSDSALKSQGLIQLKTEYCDKNKCLKCAVGNMLLNK